MIRLLISILSLPVLVGCATLPAQFRDLAGTDVQRGLDIAKAANDPAGIACAEAILKHLPAEVAAPAPTGPFSAFMAARELRRTATTGIPEAIHMACAVLIVDAELTLGRLGLAIVPGGGLLRALRP